MSRTSILIIATIVILFVTGLYRVMFPESEKLPIVAIANYGPHVSLNEIIRGVKDGLHAKGFREGRTIDFKIEDVNFDNSAITEIFDKLLEDKPITIVAISTPVAQSAKNYIKKIPIIFAGVTDPVEAGILSQYDKAEKNITGSSDRQDISLVLKFAKKLSPEIRKIGMFYAPKEANDMALLRSMKKAVKDMDMELVSIPIEFGNDITDKFPEAKDNIDMLYVGASGPVQTSLDAIVSMAEAMKIPVLNVNSDEVKKDKVFASYGVSYYKVGVHAGELISNVLRGKDIKDINPVYPTIDDHDGFISLKRQSKINFKLPRFLPKSTYIIK